MTEEVTNAPTATRKMSNNNRKEETDESSSSSSSEEEEEEDEEEPIDYDKIRSMEDLPSDDSVSVSSSDDDDNSSKEESTSDEDDDNDDDKNPVESMSLAQRLSHGSSNSEDAIMERTKRNRARKAEALKRAKQALSQKRAKTTMNAAFRQEKDDTDDDTDDDDDDVDDGSSENGTDTETEGSRKEDPKKKRRSKHAPTEASSLRKDFFGALRQRQSVGEGWGIDVQANRYKPRDPRMSSMSGHYNQDHFLHHYGFLQNQRRDEIDKLQRRLQARQHKTKRRTTALRRELRSTTLQQDTDLLQRLQEQERFFVQTKNQRQAQLSVKRQLQQQATLTGKAFYLKRRDKKRLLVQHQSKQQQQSQPARDNQQKVLAKRRQKNKSKHSKMLKG